MTDAGITTPATGKAEKKPPTKRQILTEYVCRECSIMSGDHPEGARKRSAFRLAARLPIGNSSAAWAELVQNFPEEIMAGPSADRPNLYETAAYITLMLFASAMNHEYGTDLGAAVKMADSTVLRSRLTRVEDSYGEEEVLSNLSPLLNALGRKNISTDYGTLSYDIFQLLWTEKSHVSVMQKWERSYAVTKTNNIKEENHEP